MKVLQGSQGMLRDYILLFLAITYVVRSVRQQINECVGDEADQIHSLPLSPHVRRECLFDNFIKCSYNSKVQYIVKLN